MCDWLNEAIGEDLIAANQGQDFTAHAAIWLRERPRTFAELRAEEIDLVAMDGPQHAEPWRAGKACTGSGFRCPNACSVQSNSSCTRPRKSR